MALARTRSPVRRRTKRTTQPRRSRGLLYGTSIPKSDAASFNIPSIPNIESQSGFLLFFIQNNTIRIIQASTFAKFGYEVNNLAINNTYADILCNNMVIRECLYSPITGMFSPNTTLDIAGHMISLENLKTQLANGITVISNRITPKSVSPNTLKINVRKNVVTTISEAFVNKVVEENNELLNHNS